MERLYRFLPPDKFKMLAILNKDEPAFADKMAAKLGMTFPILTSPDNMAGQAYGLTGVPETYIIDKQGILREKFIGPVQWDTPAAQQKMLQYINQ
jgi:peroxiredoxin